MMKKVSLHTHTHTHTVMHEVFWIDIKYSVLHIQQYHTHTHTHARVGVYVPGTMEWGAREKSN